MGEMSIEEYVESRIRPEQRPIVDRLRELMRELAPQATEVISYGILAWKGTRIFAVVSPTKRDITLSFSHGAQFEDQHGLLKGVGKVSKHLKIKRPEEIDRETLRYYVEQALAADQR